MNLKDKKVIYIVGIIFALVIVLNVVTTVIGITSLKQENIKLQTKLDSIQSVMEHQDVPSPWAILSIIEGK